MRTVLAVTIIMACAIALTTIPYLPTHDHIAEPNPYKFAMAR